MPWRGGAGRRLKAAHIGKTLAPPGRNNRNPNVAIPHGLAICLSLTKEL